MRKIHPGEGPDLQVIPRVTPGPTPAAVAELASYYGNGVAGANPLLRANMVASADGATSFGGRSRSLSGPADRMLFTVLRSLADLILVGAGTVRTEHYGPVKEIWAGLRPNDAPVPAIAVVSASLDLDPDSSLLTRAAPGAQTIVITTGTAPPDRRAAIAKRARVIEAGTEQLDLVVAISALRGLGYRSILTEGGPALLGHLAAAELVDELCLTTSPLLALGKADRVTKIPLAHTERLSLAHVLHDDGFLFSRYRRE